MSIYFQNRINVIKTKHFNLFQLIILCRLPLPSVILSKNRSSLHFTPTSQEKHGFVSLQVKPHIFTTPLARFYFETLYQAQQGETIFPPIVPLELIQQRGSYFTYQGSLTTPECHEKVRWIVMNKVLKISTHRLEMMKRFKANGKSIQGNFRHVQPLYGRKIYRASVF